MHGNLDASSIVCIPADARARCCYVLSHQPAYIRVRSPSQALVGVHDNATLVLALTRAVKQQLLHPIGGHVQPVLPRLTDLNSLGNL